jgi:NAD(P)-dependent dehydrogenase (short-subunit alcohol dehydrogenase family)
VIRADARVLTDTAAMIDVVRERLGSLDLLFLNAGVSRPPPVTEVTEDAFDDLTDINLKGQYTSPSRRRCPYSSTAARSF